MLDTDRDRLEKPLHQRELRLAHHVPQRVEVDVVGAFESINFLLILEHRERRGSEWFEAVLLGEASVHRFHHVMDFQGLLGAFLEVTPDRGKEIAHRYADPLGEGAGLDTLARCTGGLAQRLQADRLVERVRLLRENRSQRAVPLHAALEQILLLLDALHHVLDDVLVLAAQAAQLQKLLLDAGAASIENRAYRRSKGGNL